MLVHLLVLIVVQLMYVLVVLPDIFLTLQLIVVLNVLQDVKHQDVLLLQDQVELLLAMLVWILTIETQLALVQPLIIVIFVLLVTINGLDVEVQMILQPMEHSNQPNVLLDTSSLLELIIPIPVLLLSLQILVPKYQLILVLLVLCVSQIIKSLELVVMLVQPRALILVNIQLLDQQPKLVVHHVLPQDTFSHKLLQLPSVLVLNVQLDVVDAHQLHQLVVLDVLVDTI